MTTKFTDSFLTIFTELLASEAPENQKRRYLAAFAIMESVAIKVEKSKWARTMPQYVNPANLLIKNRHPRVPKWVFNPFKKAKASRLVRDMTTDLNTDKINEVSFVCATHY